MSACVLGLVLDIAVYWDRPSLNLLYGEMESERVVGIFERASRLVSWVFRTSVVQWLAYRGFCWSILEPGLHRKMALERCSVRFIRISRLRHRALCCGQH